MTLLVGYASDEFVVLASDRMATWTMPNGHVKRVPQINKSLFVGGQMLVAFSGVADIKGNTERWLINQFTQINGDPAKQQQWRQYLVQELKTELRRLRRGAYRNLSQRALWFSLLVVGYTGSDGKRFLGVISNAKDDSYGQAKVQNIHAFFGSFPSVDTRGDDFRLWAVGSTPEIAKLESAADALRRYRVRQPDHCLEIAKTLARVVVARSVDDPGVGDTVQLTVMPRSARGQQFYSMSLVGLNDPLDAVTCVEFNSDVPDNGHPVMNGIAVVSDGVTIESVVMSAGSNDPIGPRAPFRPPP